MNSPPRSMHPALRQYAEVLRADVQQAIDGTGARISSWWRSVAHNRSVGGHADSQHLLGWAVDVAPVSARVEQAIRSRARFRWVVVRESDHVHVQIFPAGVATDFVRRFRR